MNYQKVGRLTTDFFYNIVLVKFNLFDFNNNLNLISIQYIANYCRLCLKYNK